jgi:hypothetical protein
MTDQLVAICTREQTGQLVNYDHHRVWVDSCLGIMLTYHWMPLEDAKAPLTLSIVFHESAQQHPSAPQQIQTIINQLVITEKYPQMGT